MTVEKSKQDWIQFEIEKWLKETRLGTLRLKNMPLGVFVVPSQVQHLFFDEKPEQPSNERAPQQGVKLPYQESVQKQNSEERTHWLNQVSVQDHQQRLDSSSLASFTGVNSKVQEDSELLQITPFAQKFQTTASTGSSDTRQFEMKQSSGNLTRELADLSLSSVLNAPEGDDGIGFQGELSQKQVVIPRPQAEFDFSKDFTSNSRLGIVGRTVRYLFAHFIDLTLVVVSLLVSLVSGFFVFVFDPSLEIAASLQFSRWLPVRLVTELNLVEAFLFFYVLFAVYWAFFKLFVGATIGRSIFANDSTVENDSSFIRNPS